MIKLWLQGWKRQRDEKQQCVAHEMRNAKPRTQTMKIVLKQLNRKRYTAEVNILTVNIRKSRGFFDYSKQRNFEFRRTPESRC